MNCSNESTGIAASTGIMSESNVSQSSTSQQQVKSQKQKLMLPMDRFSYWVESILVVTFDIEMGQSLEYIYPSSHSCKLTQNEKANICYMSFPDSNSGFLGDTQYHFRIKQDKPVAPSLNQQHNNNYDDYNTKTITGLEVDKNYLFGYVFFRQVKDKTLKRGYFQKSVVLLSKFPFVSFFHCLISLIATEYFTTGGEVIETACNDIDQWPLPIPGEPIILPLLGHLIEICLPIKLEKYTLPIIYRKDFPAVPTNLPPVHEVNLYKCLQPILVHVHLLWELIILNEPIVVIATVPTICSETVQALISTVWPLKYASDYRPFFTIHNSEFVEYSSKNNIPPALVIGVTNPFFTKCLQHWPNIIKMSDTSNKQSNDDHPMIKLFDKQLSNSGKATKIKKTSSIRVVDTRPAVYTTYQPYLNKNKDVLKNLIRGEETNRPTEAQSAILRRHFIDLTQSFMIPLERYFSSLMPLHKNISPFKSVPKLKTFDAEEFMRSLKQASPELAPSLKGDWAGLYKRFFDSLNFKHWYQQKQIEAEKKLELLQLQLLCDFDVKTWCQGRHEVEIIDQYMNIKKKQDLILNNKIDADEQIKATINNVLNTFLTALPEDVRLFLHK